MYIWGMKRWILFLLLGVTACHQAALPLETGVSRQLALQRAGQLSDITYQLSFCIPDSLKADCYGEVTLSFDLGKKGPVVLDFRPGGEAVRSVEADGSAISADIRSEHIVVPALSKGHHKLHIAFTPENAPLNRHEDFLYSLLVPERARTLFPCFDQPDLKARFQLELDIPAAWVAVSNGPLREETLQGGRKHLRFEDGGLQSTYLFSFAAGVWQKADFPGVSIYHRETRPDKLAQLPEVYRLIQSSLAWMEDYTGIGMPFPKYDCVVVPGFQFGGMEHPGAILYNASRIFLSEHPTEAERLSRVELIAHETAHLWFGDAVTMEWFDDVWTKEVFANYFASQIARPQFPELDYRLQDFRNFNIPAYDEDRTDGSTPIRQQLDNLQDAGLVYGNIVYDKAPVVMRMLADTLGARAFQSGIQEYLKTYLYGNATWPALIEILDRYTKADLPAWSHRWVEDKGMPEYPESTGLPNLCAQGYGYYPMTESALRGALEEVSSLPEPSARLSTLANLNENHLHGRLSAASFIATLARLLQTEQQPLVATSALTYLANLWRYDPSAVESSLLAIASAADVPDQIRLTAFRRLMPLFTESAELFRIWEQQKPWSGLELTAEDYTTLAFELAIRRPDDYERLRTVQRSRIDHPDRLARFDFVYSSTHPDKAVRDSVFHSLLEANNRRTEPWVLESLRLLNHPLRQQDALTYIVPALDKLQEIQRTGDIFFPKNWCQSLLSGHSSPEAAALVRDWLSVHPAFPPLLKNKLLQAADPLLRQ